MIFRKALKTDITFIINAVLEIERKGESNTFNNLFGTKTNVTEDYLKAYFLDEENLDNELALNTYTIAEINGVVVGCCSVIYTDSNYYESKAELFSIHLKKNHLDYFIKAAGQLPSTKKVSENKKFIEYIFVDERFRGKGLAAKLINHQFENEKQSEEKIYLNVLESNLGALKSYKKLGFEDFATVVIDNEENSVYPAERKLILWK